MWQRDGFAKERGERWMVSTDLMSHLSRDLRFAIISPPPNVCILLSHSILCCQTYFESAAVRRSWSLKPN
jgi:hypothetical protein